MPSLSELQALLFASGKAANSYQFANNIPVRPNTLRLIKWYTSELSTVNEQIDQIEYTHNITSTCNKGCSACCSQMITVDSTELSMIEFLMKNFDKDTLTNIKEKTIQQCDILRKNNFSPQTVNMHIYSKEKENSQQEKFFSLNLPCPLLSNDNCCLVYSIRPSLCWTYRNYGNPLDCKISWNIPTTIKYDCWESPVLMRLFKARKPSKRNTLNILQFALLGLFT